MALYTWSCFWFLVKGGVNGSGCIGEHMCAVGTVIAFESSVLLYVFCYLQYAAVLRACPRRVLISVAMQKCNGIPKLHPKCHPNPSPHNHPPTIQLYSQTPNPLPSPNSTSSSAIFFPLTITSVPKIPFGSR